MTRSSHDKSLDWGHDDDQEERNGGRQMDHDGGGQVSHDGAKKKKGGNILGGIRKLD